jgi:hypothetical protein
MKMKMCSQAWLVIGLGVGVLGLWSSAAPIGLDGDLVSGAYWSTIYEYLPEAGDNRFVGCTGSPCEIHMNATTQWMSCGDGVNPFLCWGGSFLGVKAKADGLTVHASTNNHLCYGINGPNEYACYTALSTPSFHY